MRYHFISGLPRSGTTLLSAILNQNPKFNASISGPLARFTRAVIQESSSQGGYRFQCPESKRKEIIKNMFDTYYSGSNEVSFDTNRGWTLLLPLLKDLYPTSKVIVCVRDIPTILDSFEKLVQSQPYTMTSMFAENENINCYTRAETIMKSDRTLGFAYMALKQGLFSKEGQEMIKLVEYDTLVKYPEETLKSIYKFIGEEYFEHDFNNVEYANEEFDNDVALKDLHTTRKKVSYIPRKSILPPDLIQAYSGAEFWRSK